VQIKVVAQNAGGHHRIMRVLLLQRGKLIKGGPVNDHVVFDPAHLTLAGFGFKEAPSVLDHFERLSIAYQSDSI
jgi:hypothetical protein